MIIQLRDNVMIGDRDALKDVQPGQVTSVLNVAKELTLAEDEAYKYIKIGLHLDKPNPSYIKDLAAHCGKYQIQFGEYLLVISYTGLRRAAYIAARIVCESEDKGIYEILQEIKKKIPDFRMGDAYL